VKLNESGYIDATLLETSLLNFKTGFYPVAGDCTTEYPTVDQAVNVAGDFWLMLEPVNWDDTNPGEVWHINFSCGSLYKPDTPNPSPPPDNIPIGIAVNGDALIYTGEFITDDFGNNVPKFVRYRMKLNPNIYYWRDGSNPITADFQAGGHKLVNVAIGNQNDTDGVNFGQLTPYQTHIDTISGNPHGITTSMINAEPIVIVGTAGQVWATKSDLSGKEWIDIPLGVKLYL